MFKKIFSYLASVISLSTIFLYYLGKGYHIGFIKGFGVSPKLFPMSLPEYVYYGFLHPFVSFLNLITIPLFSATAILYIFILLIALILIFNNITGLFYTFMSWLKKVWINITSFLRNPQNEKNNENIDKQINRVVDITSSILYSLLGIIIFLVAIFSIAASSFKNGKVEAKRIKKNYSKIIFNEGYFNYEYVSIVQNNSKFKGLILKYSGNYILVYNEKKGAVVFNTTSINKIVPLHKQ